jgi:hypothetical protein
MVIGARKFAKRNFAIRKNRKKINEGIVHIPELGIEVQTLKHKVKRQTLRNIAIPDGWRMLDTREFDFLLQNYNDELDVGNNILEPIAEIVTEEGKRYSGKNVYTDCCLALTETFYGRYSSFWPINRHRDYTVRFCRDVKTNQVK